MKSKVYGEALLAVFIFPALDKSVILDHGTATRASHQFHAFVTRLLRRITFS
jgi:hypothetical protein